MRRGFFMLLVLGLLALASPATPQGGSPCPTDATGSILHQFTHQQASSTDTSTTRPLTPNDWNCPHKMTGGNHGEVAVRDTTKTYGWGLQLPYWHGQVRLTKSGANLQLCPYNGNKIIINSKIYTVPDACTTLGVGGLSASTTYFVYYFDNAGTLTLEASTTTHATQAGTGVEIKSGDATRSLVGLARTTSGTAWADTATQRFVASWFNRRPRTGKASFTTTRTTTSTSYVELNTEIRVEFLIWGDEDAIAAIGGTIFNSGANNTFLAMGFDGTAAENPGSFGNSTVALSAAITVHKTGLAEGYHYATALGKVGAGTGSYYADGVAGNDMTLGVETQQ